MTQEVSLDTETVRLANEARHAEAATKIQAIFRVRANRPHGRKASQNPERSQSQHRLTTFEDLWELMTYRRGCCNEITVELKDVFMIFHRARKTGLTADILDVLPVEEDHHGNRRPAEDVSPGELEHLAVLVLSRPELEVEEAHEELQVVKDICRGLEKPSSEVEMKFQSVKKVLRLVAALMNIDLVYLVQHMVWVMNGRFEMTDALARRFLQKCACMRPTRDGTFQACHLNEAKKPQELWDSLTRDGLRPVTEELKTPLTQKDFLVTVHNCDLINAREVKGCLTYGECVTFFTSVHYKIGHLKHAHATSRTQAEQAKAAELEEKQCKKGHKGSEMEKARHEATAADKNAFGLVGRVELEILLGQMWKYDRLSREFRSPLMMVVQMLRTANGHS